MSMDSTKRVGGALSLPSLGTSSSCSADSKRFSRIPRPQQLTKPKLAAERVSDEPYSMQPKLVGTDKTKVRNFYRQDSRQRAEVYAINALLREHEVQRFEAFRIEMEARGSDYLSDHDGDDASNDSSEVPSPDRPIISIKASGRIPGATGDSKSINNKAKLKSSSASGIFGAV